MNQPTVCCICLTKERPEMLARAVRSFQAQTYENKRLLIVNSGQGPRIEETDDMWEPCFVGADALTIGALRNLGNKFASAHYAESWKRPEVFCHWDDDDWSHPERLAEQVALLQASGADVVGYSDLLFWDTRRVCIRHGEANCDDCPYRDESEAWLYLGPQKALGTSLCYWWRTWERKPFPDQPRPGFTTGEDVDWIRGLKLATTKSCEAGTQPRLIAAIHGRNTSGCYKLMAGSDSWRRVPEWDSHCRERMAL